MDPDYEPAESETRISYRFVLCLGFAHYIGSIFALTQEAIRNRIYVNIA